jgi:mono/diheme cytochrome c family protein
MRIATLICLVLFGAAVIAEEASPPPVFTKEQADAGLAAYAKNCASCHMPDLTGNGEIPPLAGASFIETWEHKTTKDLRDYMSAAMPYGQPSLEADTYTVIAAYVLSCNGAVAGMEKLTPSTNVSIRDVVPQRGQH